MISRQIFGIRRGISGNVSANPRAFSSSLYPGEFNPCISKVTEHTPVLTSSEGPVTCGERQIPDTVLTPRFQTGPSAGNSFDPKEGRFSKNHGAAQQRLQITELHFEKFLTPTTFACWKIRFKTEVCTCSVKSTSLVIENHYKNGCVNYNNYKNFIKTNEDNNHDTKYTNKNDTNNHNARDLHE